jgi:hypothetical protein
MFCAPHEVLFSYSNREYEMGERCGMHGEEEHLIYGSDGKAEGKRPLSRHRYSWEGTVRADSKEIG